MRRRPPAAGGRGDAGGRRGTHTYRLATMRELRRTLSFTAATANDAVLTRW